MSTIMCTNGSKDGKYLPNAKFNCDKNDTKTCFNDSYKYCKELNTKQITILILCIIFALFLIGIINTIVSKIPLFGVLGVLAINLISLLILAVIIYMVYINIRIHKAKNN